MKKTPPGQRTKDELFWKILDAALRLEITKGHLRWKMTDLSRASGVTRSLIYYYFGQSKESILQAAIDILGEEFFALSDARQALWDQGKIAQSIQKTRELVKNMPHISIFYLNQRQPGSPFEKEIRKLEKRYRQKLVSRFPQSDPQILEMIFATFFGWVTISEPSEETLQKMLPGVIGLLSR